MLTIDPASWPVLLKAWPKVTAAICCALESNTEPVAVNVQSPARALVNLLKMLI